VLINLINNAFKFSREGRIEVGCVAGEGGMLVFYVSDKGVGIPADKQSMIFNLFAQPTSDYTKNSSGMGLGLPIAKRLVELMGGKIWLESYPDEGSTFYFSVPESASTDETTG
jgi:signal transduction histidine kinase